MHNQSTRNADTLSLAAAEGMRKTPQVFDIQAAAQRDLAHTLIDV